jgi:NADH dehydrogenase
VVWLVFHIWILIGFRNRLVVLINWAWDYLLYDRAVRLITRPETADPEDGGAQQPLGAAGSTARN